MGLSSIFQRKGGAPAATDGTDEVQQARTRARRRLIGAVVLLCIGIVGFPLVFETQPRPIPVDIPIEIPPRESAAPLSLPPAPAAVADARGRPESKATPAAAADDMITEPRDEPAPPAASTRPDNRTAAPATPSAKAPPTTPPPKPAAEAKVAGGVDGARAKALLEGAAPAASSAARFVVQVGAFADAGAAQDTRMKMEKLGLRTYTQVASTAAGGRVRVRVGPFSTREEADRALARARVAGLSGVVIAL